MMADVDATGMMANGTIMQVLLPFLVMKIGHIRMSKNNQY